MFIAFLFIVERTYKKGVAIFDATGTNLQQKFNFNEQNVNYEHCHSVETIKSS